MKETTQQKHKETEHKKYAFSYSFHENAAFLQNQ